MGLFLRTTVQGKVKMKVKLQLGHKVKESSGKRRKSRRAAKTKCQDWHAFGMVGTANSHVAPERLSLIGKVQSV